MIDTLFGPIPAASRGQQWVARDLQLVNWGGYDGYHHLRLAPGATLLSGGSGSGKSTLMDSYIALLMPHTTPFNGASNGGVVGRPRGRDQRNILSYARGKLDESRVDGETKLRVLRGDGRDTWSAIAMTWADHTGAEFTALRAWYVPSSARGLDEVVAVRATCDHSYRLRALEGPANKKLARADVEATGLRCCDTDRDFTARLHTTLGIGAAGDGHKAVALLGRIQAGQQITTVDALYKTMVLEEPSTLATADAVVQQFDELSGTRTRMITARQQVKALTPIREHRHTIDEAADRLRLIDGIGSLTDTSSPAALWRHERRLHLLRAAEKDLAERHRRAKEELAETTALVKATEVQRDGVADTLRASGGDRLDTALREIRGVEQRLGEVERSRERLDRALDTIGASVSTGDDFVALVETAHRSLADTDARRTVQNQFAEAMAEKKEADRELARLRAEHKAVKNRRGNIPTELHAARAALAEAAGLSPDSLPFVGELIEVRTEFEPWREAFNLALGGFATRMLIDIGRLNSFREAINAVPTARRIQFEGVPTGLRDEVGLDDKKLPGRLDYRPSPFTPWLKSEFARRFDYVCVETPRLLAQHPKALTVTGQTSEGGRGAHGGHGRANLLGFTNNRSLADLESRIGVARERLDDAVAWVSRAEGDLNSFETRRTTYQTLTELSWDQVDVESVKAERAGWNRVVEEVRAGNPRIDQLQGRLDELKERVRELTERVGRQKDNVKMLGESWESTVDEVDRAQRALDTAVETGADVGQEHRAYLETLFDGDPDSTAPAEALAEFDAAVKRATERLRADRQSAAETIGRSKKALLDTFSTFVERWPNPNLGVDADASYRDFDRLLTDLETSGLHELESEWRNSLLKLSGNDLTGLDSELAAAVREIRDRIDPVNRILAELPFADDKHRLRIDPQESHSAVRSRFRKELREVRAFIDQAATDDDRERAYHRMVKVIDRIRRTAPDFADLVDVRNHVRISAEKRDLEGGHVAVYDHIGEKSGGESQELVAFIVGAALRYQLGDAGADRPRYAPVFLDEALIKADAHFTGRAIGAWRGLGFQLVIGAPNDKHSAIEPHVDVEYLILKNSHGRSWAKPLVGV
ncbi:SbcC/MukB-like Walker B domain-containing protein [Sphaerisporangium sp. TRM90804]|uniref:ATP-binding protein n=1 Tax=Sphaerisporangium sp. TRM90804 TaxID=3031113 RepID=UPI002447FBD9|nr:SbcC/MukB-like Walker B domain-containing protein [Sphaerisporangium sp. TRM90804]MDH2426407.1 SbcC/MukB-like Walker B domain-containing protein [Sphaerisporangium sp. TRM90804]